VVLAITSTFETFVTALWVASSLPLISRLANIWRIGGYGFGETREVALRMLRRGKISTIAQSL
jgi:hypothetical protein